MENDNIPNGNRKKIDQIRQSLMEGSAPKAPSKPRKKAAPPSLSVVGSNNIVGDGNSLNIYNGTPVEKKIVVVKTGDGVLTAAQKAKINALIDEWVEARGAVRRSRAEIAGLRRAFNKAMNVNSYAEILQEDFDKAIAWLRRQTGIVNSMASAPVKNPKWRNGRYRAINARAKEFPDGELRYRRYAEERFGSASLKELSDEHLEAVYRYVFGWRRAQD